MDEAAAHLQHSCRRHRSTLVECSERERRKLHGGHGGVWRLPPSFDGHRRSPLPRFTTLTAEDLDNLHASFSGLHGVVRVDAVDDQVRMAVV